ncbi:hypothetical protein CN498_23675 [Bacillus thuringiensis]|uniref:Uncharacterized protein n=1 Tax=Bacillus cereus (strain G9842) TaxID=405531 RepID=B7IRZ4_BACC2|nr:MULTISPECIES: hypothetical protein [Bacillus cereus group]PFE28773.1 hypothetical protein CN279_04145 [Bacillus anthracis]ACK96945.1 hypothetical protein BCG9842_B5362 [Bacillus cereus G9842]MDR4137256.1 hypothetical protein [Bacillus cereus]MDR4365819.1 hypothetical protein [Bacillus cereus]PER84788.1 hypothetical protein CN498_23675 [Bacillus thuringiensis]
MSIIRLFRDYIEEHHPHLAEKEWIVDIRTLSATMIQNEEVKAMIPNEIKDELKCWIFYYNGGVSNIVYLLQDKRGLLDIGMGLLKDGELVKPISFV